MLNILYIASFALIVLGLLLWTTFNAGKADRFFRGMTLTALAAYVLSWGLQVAPVEYKLEIAFRDLLVIAASGAVFTFVARKRKLFLLLLALTLLGGYWYFKYELRPSFPFIAESAQTLDQEGELLLELNKNIKPKEQQKLQSWADRHQVELSVAFTSPARADETDLDDYLIANTPADLALDEALRELRAFSFVDWVEFNETVQISPLPAQRLPKKIHKKYGINDPGLEQLWSFEQMEMDKLYHLLEQKQIQPQKQALIAILDTGVDSKHEDLKANYTSTESKSDDDPKGHGTHCAGIAAAVSNNGVGVASFSRDNLFVQVTSIKVLNGLGYGTQKSIINGIIKAADNGADVISLSLGGPSDDRKQRAYSQAVAYANKAGAIVVAAAGNSNMNAKNYSPVNAKGIIGVSAVDHELNRAPFSNFVQDISMGLAAPGVGIYSTVPDSKYATFNGTSMATPYVAGLLGLLKSLDPDLDTQRAHRILKKSGKKTQATRETGMFIQPEAAVRELLR